MIKLALQRTGFTLIEVLVSVAIVAMLATIVAVYLLPARTKGRDAKRKVDISQIGRFLSAGCYMPDAGSGEYDMADLAGELKVKYPDYGGYLSNLPYDPKTGDSIKTNYRYGVTTDGRKCALYANLETDSEPITLPNLTAPAPGGGNGVLAAPAVGWNGTNKYFQFSN
ncbi:MAG: type II secretion system protein [Patescibacteria group bacterium]